MPVDERELLVRRLFALEQIAGTLVDMSDAVLRAMFQDIVAEIVRLDPGGVAPRYRDGRLEKLRKRVREIVGPAYDQLYAEQRAALASVGASEAAVTTTNLRAVLGAGAAGRVAPTTGLGVNYFKALINTKPLDGVLLKDWFADQSRHTVRAVEREIKLGMLNGRSVGDLVRLVRGKATGKRGQYVGGVMQTTTRNAESIVRTAVNDIGNTARMATFEANADILSTTEWVSTLDASTCEACAAMDGMQWKLGDPNARRPPLHVRDRCAIIANVDWGALGLEPPPDGTRATRIDPATGKPGQVSSEMHYSEWLKGQPASLQDEILGPKRAKLFREGRVSLRDLVRTDGRRIPLSELSAA